jgi:hypothetical protein
MSAADSSLPAASKFAPLQKWYLLFPENWAQLAFDRDWRTQRLSVLIENQKQQAYRFWITLGIVWLVLLLPAVGLLFPFESKPDFGHSTFVIAIMIAVLIQHAVVYVAAQVERILLQVVDRLERDKT